MEKTLDKILPKIFPEGSPKKDWILIPHRGKTDLKKSISKKLKSWNETNSCFIILRDNDGGDCKSIKNGLKELIPDDKQNVTLIRIVCQTLESWFLGDLKAVGKAYPKSKAEKMMTSRKYRIPDNLTNAEEELKNLTKFSEKVERAAAIASHMDCGNNQSKSFQVFVSGIQKLYQQCRA